MTWLDLKRGILEEFAERAAGFEEEIFSEGGLTLLSATTLYGFRYHRDDAYRAEVLSRYKTESYRAKNRERMQAKRKDPAYHSQERASQHAYNLSGRRIARAAAKAAVSVNG